MFWSRLYYIIDICVFIVYYTLHYITVNTVLHYTTLGNSLCFLSIYCTLYIIHYTIYHLIHYTLYTLYIMYFVLHRTLYTVYYMFTMYYIPLHTTVDSTLYVIYTIRHYCRVGKSLVHYQ